MKKQLLTAALAGLLSASAIMSAFASGGGVTPTAEGTDVYAGILLNDPEAKISVKVPTLFAFVVQGSVDAADTGAVTSADNTVLLPNIKVVVNDPTSPNSDYTVDFVGNNTNGSGTMRFENSSTKKAPLPVTAGDPDYLGIPVTISGSIKNEGSAASRNYWEHIANADDATLHQGQTAGFKKYTLSVANQKFTQATTDGGFKMAANLTLAAPDLGWNGTTYSNLNTTTKYANVGSLTDADFDVFVGGQQNQYNQVEQSAKVGTIVWTVGYQIENDGNTDTSPSLPPLQP